MNGAFGYFGLGRGRDHGDVEEPLRGSVVVGSRGRRAVAKTKHGLNEVKKGKKEWTRMPKGSTNRARRESTRVKLYGRAR